MLLVRFKKKNSSRRSAISWADPRVIPQRRWIDPQVADDRYGERVEIMKALFVLNDPPYGTERCYNALRLAHALLKTIQVRKSRSYRWAICL